MARRKEISKSNSSRPRKPAKRPSVKKNAPPSKAFNKSKVSAAPKRPAARRKLQRTPRFLGKSDVPSAYDQQPSNQESLQPALNIDRRLPPYYGEDRMALLIRDPWWVYTYWEVTPFREEEIIARMPWGDRDRRVRVLRVYDLTDASFDRPVSFFDIELRVPADSWYVDVGEPDRAWGAEIGYRLPDGRFWALVRSNIVRTPRFGFSDVFDEEWMIPDEDFWKLVGGFEAEEFGLSSGEFHRRKSAAGLAERFLRQVSSDGSAKFSNNKSGPPADKGSH